MILGSFFFFFSYIFRFTPPPLGVDMYKKAFFTNEYLARNPTHSAKLDLFKSLLGEQLSMVEKGLGIHAAICPPVGGFALCCV